MTTAPTTLRRERRWLMPPPWQVWLSQTPSSAYATPWLISSALSIICLTASQYDHPHTLARYAEVADYLGLGGKNDSEKLENLIKAINDLKDRIGIKKTIKDYGIDEKDFLDRLDAMTEQAFDDQCTGANPRYPLMSEIKQMYLNAYYGTHEEV